jgi:hypothetical protein
LARAILTLSMLLVASVAVAGCGGGRSVTPAPEAAVDTAAEATASISRVSIARAKPIDAYVLLGGRIKKCWFNPVAPLLPDHVYRADVSPDSSKVKITVHEKQNLGRAGASTYAIDFRQEGPSTVIVTENRKMTPELAAKMQYDIDRWKRGEPDCNKVMPPAIPAAPAPAKDAKAER